MEHFPFIILSQNIVPEWRETKLALIATATVGFPEHAFGRRATKRNSGFYQEFLPQLLCR
jgi:hypothetical protein